MTTNQVLLGVGLILVLASRLKIPALIILLPVGFTRNGPPEPQPGDTMVLLGLAGDGA